MPEQRTKRPARIDIKVMQACKWLFSGLPVLTYIYYAALRIMKTTILDSA